MKSRLTCFQYVTRTYFGGSVIDIEAVLKLLRWSSHICMQVLTVGRPVFRFSDHRRMSEQNVDRFFPAKLYSILYPLNTFARYILCFCSPHFNDLFKPMSHEREKSADNGLQYWPSKICHLTWNRPTFLVSWLVGRISPCTNIFDRHLWKAAAWLVV